MGEKIVIGPVNHGLRTDRTAFNIDDDSFPMLINAYQWRGRIKRKRGTQFLCRLQRFFNSASVSYYTGGAVQTDANGRFNLLTGFGLESTGQIIPGSVTFTVNGIVYTDPTEDGLLTPSAGGTNTINYGSSIITLPAQPNQAITLASFLYYPGLPVMGLEDLVLQGNQFPNVMGFDTKYSYFITSTEPYSSYDVSFYKNPATGPAGYVPKATPTPVRWNGQDYQQFWTTNYQGAIWATNGIPVGFSPTNIGMQFGTIGTVTVTSPTTALITIAGHPLIIGDWVWINEVLVTTGINFQTGFVTNTVPGVSITVTFPNATLTTNGTGGIAQYLTNNSDSTKDCIRFYDGDPTDGTITTPVLNGHLGWVNFCPPLAQFNYSVAELPLRQYYLVGGRMIFPFQDRLLVFGPVVQGNSGAAIYLQDTVIFSENGTPYYTASYTNNPFPLVDNPIQPTNVLFPLLVPVNQTSNPPAWFEDQTGFGGYRSAGVDQAINTVFPHRDMLICGFDNMQTRLVYKDNDIQPFDFHVINSELGSSSPFSGIVMDSAVLTRGSRGFVMTNENSGNRFDLAIPDSSFEINLLNNGTERICSQRDFINEWIYFTYPSDETNFKFPNQTLLFNYRDNSWAQFNECYTTYGSIRKKTGDTWATIGEIYETWSEWNDPWNAGVTELLQPQVIGGNQQGFVLVKGVGTGEGESLYIENISFPATITGAVQVLTTVTLTANNTFIVGQSITVTGVVGSTQLNGNTFVISAVTPTTIQFSYGGPFTAYVSGGIATPLEPVYSPNHTLNDGDYIIIKGAIGTISGAVNNKIFSVAPSVTTNGFSLNPSVSVGTYFGGATITRMYVPQIQTKQFPTAWNIMRKTRLGPQMYLLTRTDKAQVTLLIFISQDSSNAYNSGNIVPAPVGVDNSGLIYSSILYTCPESTNLGLTPANTNLQMLAFPGSTAGTGGSSTSQQLWHRINTSLIGDTVQIGITMNDVQMRDTTFSNQFAEIELHSILLDVSPSQVLS